MSSKRLDSLSDYARHGYRLRVDCECGRVKLLEPHALLKTIIDRGWESYSLEGLAMRLRCGKCGRRPSRIGPGFGEG